MRRFIILGLGGVFAIASFAGNETMAAPEGSVFHALAPLAGVAREAPPAMADEQLAAVEGGMPFIGFASAIVELAFNLASQAIEAGQEEGGEVLIIEGTGPITVMQQGEGTGSITVMQQGEEGRNITKIFCSPPCTIS